MAKKPNRDRDNDTQILSLVVGNVFLSIVFIWFGLCVCFFCLGLFPKRLFIVFFFCKCFQFTSTHGVEKKQKRKKVRVLCLLRIKLVGQLNRIRLSLSSHSNEMYNSDWIKEMIFDSYLAHAVCVAVAARASYIFYCHLPCRVNLLVFFFPSYTTSFSLYVRWTFGYVWYAWTHTERMYTYIRSKEKREHILNGNRIPSRISCSVFDAQVFIHTCMVTLMRHPTCAWNRLRCRSRLLFSFLFSKQRDPMHMCVGSFLLF